MTIGGMVFVIISMKIGFLESFEGTHKRGHKDMRTW